VASPCALLTSGSAGGFYILGIEMSFLDAVSSLYCPCECGLRGQWFYIHLKRSWFQLNRCPTCQNVFLSTRFEDTFHCHGVSVCVRVCVCVQGRYFRPVFQKPVCSAANVELPSSDKWLQYFTVPTRMHAFCCVTWGRGGRPMAPGESCSAHTAPFFVRR